MIFSSRIQIGAFVLLSIMAPQQCFTPNGLKCLPYTNAFDFVYFYRMSHFASADVNFIINLF